MDATLSSSHILFCELSIQELLEDFGRGVPSNHRASGSHAELRMAVAEVRALRGQTVASLMTMVISADSQLQGKKHLEPQLSYSRLVH